jgi:hypothetical protein
MSTDNEAGASAPAGGKKAATAEMVRNWAARTGLTVGRRGHLPVDVISKFNHRHHRWTFQNQNPWLKGDRRS